jgi:cytochrome b561
MSLKSTPRRYGSVAILIHWVTAAAIAAMLATGLMASNATDAGAETGLLRFHAIVGVCIALLTVFRIVWWVVFDRRPEDGASPSRLEHLAARGVHYGLYLVILVMVASGMGTLILSGGNLVLFGGGGTLPDFTQVPPFTVHAVVSRLLLLLALGHIGAALFHQFIRRDNLLARMGLGR